MLEFIVLGVLGKQSLTGYDIKKVIEKGVGVFYKASYGTLYPLLSRLTEKGFLTVKEEANGGRQKKYYEVTAKGRTRFMSWLTQADKSNDNSDTRLAKVYFFDLLPKEVRREQMLIYKKNNETYLEQLLALWNHFDAMDNKECFYYKLSTLCYGIANVKQTIAWCEHVSEEKPLSELIQ